MVASNKSNNKKEAIIEFFNKEYLKMVKQYNDYYCKDSPVEAYNKGKLSLEDIKHFKHSIDKGIPLYEHKMFSMLLKRDDNIVEYAKVLYKLSGKLLKEEANADIQKNSAMVSSDAVDFVSQMVMKNNDNFKNIDKNEIKNALDIGTKALLENPQIIEQFAKLDLSKIISDLGKVVGKKQ